MQVTVATPVRSTEDPALVEQAVRRLFPDVAGEQAGDRFIGTTQDLHGLRSRVWELRIIDTVRGQVLHGAPSDDATRTRFRLSKQAALAGKVSFPPSPHALGDLEVTIDLEGDAALPNVGALAAWLCPETRDGEIVGPKLP